MSDDIFHKTQQSAYMILQDNAGSGKIDAFSMHRLLTIISTSPAYSYSYAKDILKGRFEQGEPAISKNASYSLKYAKDVLGGRFELGEKSIARNVETAYEYARDIIKERWYTGEKEILKNSWYAYLYAKNVIKRKVSIVEDAIGNDPLIQLLYKLEVPTGN